jgi:hypothetical protein
MRGLAAFLPDFSAPDFSFGEWVSSERREDGVITLGYFDFSPRASDFIQSTYDLGLIRPELGWPSWLQTPEARALLNEPEKVASASAEQLSNVLTALVRGDRFNDGLLARAWESGMLLAIVRRAAVLSEPPPPRDRPER